MEKSNSPASVLIVDDSSLLRKGLRALFEQEADFIVVGEAASGDEALALARQLRPQLVTMDIQMPGMNGLQAIEWIMAECPTRILVVSDVPHFEGLDTSFEALSRGALELIAKPALDSDRPCELIRLARLLVTLPVVPHMRARRNQRRARLPHHHGDQLRCDAQESTLAPRPLGARALARVEIVGMGASTGGPGTIRAVLETLPRSFPVPVVIVQHMADAFSGAFVQWLGRSIRLRVEEAIPDTLLQPGTVYVAIRGQHIVIGAGKRLLALDAPPRCGHRPSVDDLLQSLASSYGPNALGVLLTGMGRDGAIVLKALADAGGVTVAQNEASARVFGMPAAAIEQGAAQYVLDPAGITHILSQLGAGRRCERDR